MTRHAASARLDEMTVRLTWLRRHLPSAVSALALRAPDSRGTASPGIRGSDISKPTESSALAGMVARQQYVEIDELARDANNLLGQLITAVRAVGEPVMDTARTARRERCSGGVDDWAKPNCSNLAVRNVDVGVGHPIPLCWSCRSRYRRWKSAQSAQSERNA